MSETIEGYCHKCKSKQEMTNVEHGMTKTGVPMKKGKCAVCETTIVVIGPKPKVPKQKKEKAPKEVKEKKPRKQKAKPEIVEENIPADDEE